jgi:aspartate racemase
VLPLLPAHVRDRVVSLVDVIFAAVERTDTRHLMLCTEGTRQMRLFERHERWRVAGNRIVMPDVADQRAIHALIYDIKMHRSWRGELKFVIDAMARYGVESCIAGCTEMHILAARCHAHARLAKRFVCVDPLEIIASQMSCPVATV